MAEEAILDAPQIVDQVDPEKPVPLPEEHRVKLDSIVQKMIRNKESDENIRFVVGDFKSKYGKPPPVAPAPKPKPTFNWQGTPFETVETTTEQYQQMGAQPLQTRASMAATNVKNAFGDIDEVIKDHFMEEKGKADADQRQNLGIDNTNASIYIPPELIKKQKESERAAIPKEAVEEFKNDPQTQRFLVRKKVADFKKQGNEGAAQKLQASTYLLDAEERATPDKVKKIEDNAAKIESGELVYDTESGRLFKPLSTGNGILDAFSNRNRDYKDAGKLMLMPKEEGIAYIKKRLKEVDPDEGVPIPGTIAGLIGSEGFGTAKSLLTSAAVTSLTLSPNAGQVAGAAVSGEEQFKRSWISEMLRGYDQLSRKIKQENPNLSDKEVEDIAYDEAFALATKQASTDFAANAAMTYTGLKLGNKPLNFAPSRGVINAAKNITGATKDFIKKAIPEVAVTGALASTAQAVKNELANSAGVYRDADEGVLESGAMGAAMPLVIGALVQAPSVAKKQFVHSFRKTPIEAVAKTASEMVQDGSITPEQAEQAVSEVHQYQTKDAQIPETVKGDQRLEAKDLMDEYNANKEKLSKPEEGGLHESVTKPIKERQKEIEWEMNLRQQAPEDQMKLLKSRAEELRSQIDEHDAAKTEGKTGKLEDRAAVKKQLTDFEKRIAATEEKINDPLYKAQKMIDEDLADGYAEWTENDMYKRLGQENPEGLVKFIAEQAQMEQLSQTSGKLESSREITEQLFGKELTKIAVEKYPAPIQVSPPKVLLPDHASNVKETIAIAPDKSLEVTPAEKSRISVTLPKREATADAITIKPEEAAGQPPIEPPTPKTEAIHVDRPEVEMSHRGLQDVANEFGLEDVSTRNSKTDQQLSRDAEATVKSWVEKGEYNSKIEDLVSKTEKKQHTPTDEEFLILKAHLKSLAEEASALDINSPEYDAKLQGINRVVRAAERARSEAGASLRVAGTKISENTREAFMQRNMEETGATVLTEKQKAANAKEFEEFEATTKAYEEKIAKLEADNIRLQAEKELKKQAAKASKTKVKKDFAKERTDIYASMKEKLRKARSETSVVAVPYAKELIAIAPDVAKLVKNLVEEGVTELADVVKRIHKDLKEDLPDLQERDIHNIIAGEYAEKKQTRNSAAEQLVNLRMEAKLANQLEALMAGQKKAATEKSKIQYNKKVEDLRNKIKSLENEKSKIIKDAEEALHRAEKAEKEAKDADERQAKAEDRDAKRQQAKEYREMWIELTKKTPEEQALGAIKTRTKNAIKDIEEKIAAGQFGPDEKKAPTPLDKEAIALKDKLAKLKVDRDVRLLKEKYASERGWEKYKRIANEIGNIPRTIMSSIDLSGMGRQGLVAAAGYPKIAKDTFVLSLKAAGSEKVFNRYFYDLQNSPDYQMMLDSKLGLTDPLDPKMSAREEAFMGGLVQRIPFLGRAIKLGDDGVKIPFTNKKIREIGGGVKGSERSYVLTLNKLRVDIFRKGVDAFIANGKTPENSPELYKALAEHINNLTGRGNISGKLENAVPLLNSLFFSPRLIASRLNLLFPVAYARMPKEIKMMYAKDMASFAVLGATMAGLYTLAGYDIELDPRSTDFLKARDGDVRVDFMGGFGQYIRSLAQIITGKKISPSGKEKSLDGSGMFGEDRGDVLSKFSRGKLAPVPGLATDLVTGRDVVGNEITYDWSFQEGNKEKPLPLALLKTMIPMVSEDYLRVWKNKDPKSVALLLLSTFGQGVQEYGEPKGGSGGGSGATGSANKPSKPNKPTKPKRD